MSTLEKNRVRINRLCKHQASITVPTRLTGSEGLALSSRILVGTSCLTDTAISQVVLSDILQILDLQSTIFTGFPMNGNTANVRDRLHGQDCN